MGNAIKVIISAILAALGISLLWMVIPITLIWIISYIFTIIAITGIAFSFIVYGKKTTSVPQGHAFPITAVIYAIASSILSVVMVILDNIGIHFNERWYIIIHAVLFIFFVIRVIILVAGAEHINKVDGKTEEKHANLNKDKENYW